MFSIAMLTFCRGTERLGKRANAINTIHLTKTTVAKKEVALRYRSVRGLYFLAVDLCEKHI